MSDAVIRVEGLAKHYAIGAHKQQRETFREMLTRQLTTPLRRMHSPPGANAAAHSIWALRDVSFQVGQGEVVGIIGRNGAGKSTLLKILSRITEPTAGRVELRGRVASLLEVGTGFHSELTGRENIFLNGAILGMSRREIALKFDAIVAFAEVERFLDTPVKHYSSGMYVRLAFAVAAHLEPEILVVDEVLAVGDAQFQRKCLGRMESVARSGRTVLFVSHNMGAVRGLCSSAILLDAGSIAMQGTVDDTIAAYLTDVFAADADTGCWQWAEADAPGGNEVRLLSVTLEGERSGISSGFAPDERFSLCLTYRQTKRLTSMRFVVQLLMPTGEIAFTSTDQTTRGQHVFEPGTYNTRVTVPGGLLNTSRYLLRVWAGVPGIQRLVEPIEVGAFDVIDAGNQNSCFGNEHWPGVVCPMLDWTVTRSSSN